MFPSASVRKPDPFPQTHPPPSSSENPPPPPPPDSLSRHRHRPRWSCLRQFHSLRRFSNPRRISWSPSMGCALFNPFEMVFVGTLVDIRDAFFRRKKSNDLRQNGSGFSKLICGLVSFWVFVIAYEQIGTIEAVSLLVSGFMFTYDAFPIFIVDGVFRILVDYFLRQIVVGFWFEPLKLGLTETLLAVHVAVFRVFVGTLVDIRDVLRRNRSGILEWICWLVLFWVYVIA
ncbi:hypothetical protein LOK49_LG06G00263 [Camellia lanceoleosa]|uniref:Uncharacterized protein n=1 Tax=Camellia lanceoleosa TaxID=1840588 RepID=A0ACC0H8T3_9ERIC|nr:hypothetical protein LOK49_LG06G00263 [Camellia lanceoleosa]